MAKMNVDFLKNCSCISDLSSHIPKIPKIKAHGIFNINSEKNNAVESERYVQNHIIDRSQAKISTISSLVDGAPNYDYSFGNLTINDVEVRGHSEVNMTRSRRGIGNDGESEKDGKKSMTFSEKLTKQYKELSEFKLKHILCKKTVVQKTEIEIDMYRQSYEEERANENDEIQSDKSEVKFRFYSLPAVTVCDKSTEFLPTELSSPRKAKTNGGDDDDDDDDDDSDADEIERNRTHYHPQPAIVTPPANISTLWSLKKKSLSKLSTSVPDNIGENADESEKKIQKASSESKIASHRQAFNNMCDRAKKRVNAKIRKIRYQYDNKTGAKTPEPETAGSALKADVKTLSTRRNQIRPASKHSFTKTIRRHKNPQPTLSSSQAPVARRAWQSDMKSFRESFESNYSVNPLPWRGDFKNSYSSDQIRENASSPLWKSELANSKYSVESINSSNNLTKRRCLQLEDTLEDYDNHLIIGRTVPSVPKRGSTPESESRTSSQLLSNSKQSHRKSQDRTEVVEVYHQQNRKSAIDSIDSDSCIPQSYRKSKSHIQESVQEIEKNKEAWSANQGSDAKGFEKKKSVDIFLNNNNVAFDDFDDQLNNVPIIHITHASLEAPVSAIGDVKSSAINFKQSAIVDESPTKNINVNINKLISKFEIDDGQIVQNSQQSISPVKHFVSIKQPLMTDSVRYKKRISTPSSSVESYQSVTMIPISKSTKYAASSHLPKLTNKNPTDSETATLSRAKTFEDNISKDKSPRNTKIDRSVSHESVNTSIKLAKSPAVSVKNSSAYASNDKKSPAILARNSESERMHTVTFASPVKLVTPTLTRIASTKKQMTTTNLHQVNAEITPQNNPKQIKNEKISLSKNIATISTPNVSFAKKPIIPPLVPVRKAPEPKREQILKKQNINEKGQKLINSEIAAKQSAKDNLKINIINESNVAGSIVQSEKILRPNSLIQNAPLIKDIHAAKNPVAASRSQSIQKKLAGDTKAPVILAARTKTEPQLFVNSTQREKFEKWSTKSQATTQDDADVFYSLDAEDIEDEFPEGKLFMYGPSVLI